MCCIIEPKTDWLDLISQIASIVIAVANLGLAYYIFFYNKKQNKVEKKKSNNLEWLKALVLNENLTKLYAFFDELNTISLKFRKARITMDRRSKVTSELETEVENFRQYFIELLIAINPHLYDAVLEKVDNLYEDLSLSASDEGKNLNHDPLFKEEFSTKINKCKTDIIGILFNYDGS